MVDNQDTPGIGWITNLFAISDTPAQPIIKELIDQVQLLT